MAARRSDSQGLSGGEESMARLTDTGAYGLGDKTALGDVEVHSVALNLGS